MSVKTLSGETLSLIADYIQRLNRGEIDARSCGRMIGSILVRREALVELDTASSGAAFNSRTARERSIGPESLAKLNTLLPWTSFNGLGENRVLGSAWSSSKRAVAQRLPDATIDKLNQRYPLRDLSILEAGCYEGHHTASLAHYGAKLWAFDGRVENVVKTLVRLWVLGLEHSAVVHLINLEGDPVREQLSRLGRADPFDLVHHRGVLYHLSRPVEHLIDMASLCASAFYLHTHIAKDSEVNSTHRSDLGDFAALVHDESQLPYSPFAGMTDRAVWLTKNTLFKVLAHSGFKEMQVISEREERHGLRIELLALREASAKK